MKKRGYTLIELLIVMCFVMIIWAIAFGVPMLYNWLIPAIWPKAPHVAEWWISIGKTFPIGVLVVFIIFCIIGIGRSRKP